MFRVPCSGIFCVWYFCFIRTPTDSRIHILPYNSRQHLWIIWLAFSLWRLVWGNKTKSIPPLFVEVPVTTQECERSYICLSKISIFPLSVIFLLDFRNVPTVRYFLFYSTCTLSLTYCSVPLINSRWQLYTN